MADLENVTLSTVCEDCKKSIEVVIEKKQYDPEEVFMQKIQHGYYELKNEVDNHDWECEAT